MCVNVDVNVDDWILLLFYVVHVHWLYVLNCILIHLLLLCVFVVYVLVGYRYSRREALAVGRLEGGDEIFSSVIIFISEKLGSRITRSDL